MLEKRRYIPLLGLGFFALVAQVLLFREVVAVFEYNELGIGAFYTAWLFWVGVGALLGRREWRWGAWAVRHFSWVVLGYIPLYIVQHVLVTHARGMAGVRAYDLFPLAAMFGMMVLVNAPVSLLTGFLFPVACRWAGRFGGIAAGRVYAFECLGACLGGIFAMALLWRHACGQTVFLWACVLALAALAAGKDKWRIAILGVLAVVSVCDVPGNLGQYWTAAEDHAAWSRLLSGETYSGSFATARGRYLYGERKEQFIAMSGGGVCDTLPGGDHDAEVAAQVTAQCPDLREVLAFGPDALGICAKWCSFPTVAHVVWMHPDPEYTKALSAHLAGRLPAKLEALDADLRLFARTTARRFDAIALNLPDVTTLTLNRFCMRECFAELAHILTENGVLGVRVSGGANYLGGELADLGATMLATLKTQFKHVVIKPGDETWLIASNGDGLRQAPEEVRERYAGIAGATAVYPAEGVAALYPADRAAFQWAAYEQAAGQMPPEETISTDRRPRALGHALFLALKQAEWRVFSRMLRYALGAGVWLFGAPLLVFALFRAVYLLKTKGERASLFDGNATVFSAGFAGMAFGVALMFLYQARFGSLFLDIGMVTALFMIGGAVGSASAGTLLARLRAIPARRLLLAVLCCHAALLLAAAFFPAWSKGIWFAGFFLGGVFTGVYFPLVAKQKEEAGESAGTAGADLELCDHAGGAAGALVTGVFLLPLFGAPVTMGLLAAVMAVNIPPLLLPQRGAARDGDWFDRAVRPCGYVLAGIAVCFLLVSQLAANASAAHALRTLDAAAQALTGKAELRKETVSRPDGGEAAYFSVASGDGYVFSSDDWTAAVNGYGGPIALIVYTDAQGHLRDYDVRTNNETPAYLRLVQEKKARLAGRNLFAPDPFAGVDGVSGASVTGEAVTQLLENAGRGFAKGALHKEMGDQAVAAGTWGRGARDFAVLGALMLAAIVLRFKPSPWRRRMLLLVSFLAGGLWLNEQFSTQQAVLLSGFTPKAIALTGAFFLLIVVPVATALFGNVYCGYVCPFGALQELAGECVPGGPRPVPKTAWRYARALKYAFLFFLLVLYACTRDGTVLKGDLLITLFGKVREQSVVFLAAAVLLLSLFSPRFWCRNLCPAGAFLSLFNGVYLLRRWMPPRYPRECPYGVRNVAELDCIHCDRCVSRQEPVNGHKRKRYVAFLVCVALVLACAVSLSVSAITLPMLETPNAIAPGSAGQPRAVNVETFKRMIQEGTLSDREAEFYGKDK